MSAFLLIGYRFIGWVDPIHPVDLCIAIALFFSTFLWTKNERIKEELEMDLVKLAVKLEIYETKLDYLEKSMNMLDTEKY